MKRDDTIQRFRQILLRRRHALRKALDGELSQLGGQVDDETYEDDMYSQLARTEGRELTAIEYALDRMRDGQYGTCEQCGHSIPLARLQALPHATLCINCQRKLERLGRVRQSPGNEVAAAQVAD